MIYGSNKKIPCTEILDGEDEREEVRGQPYSRAAQQVRVHTSWNSPEGHTWPRKNHERGEEDTAGRRDQGERYRKKGARISCRPDGHRRCRRRLLQGRAVQERPCTVQDRAIAHQACQDNKQDEREEGET